MRLRSILAIMAPNWSEAAQARRSNTEAGGAPDGALDGVAPAQLFEGLGFGQQIEANRHKLQRRDGGADGYGQLRRCIVQFGGQLGRQDRPEKGQRVPGLALDQEVRLKGADDEFGAGRGAGEEDPGDRLVLLMLEKVERGPQFPAQGQQGATPGRPGLRSACPL